MKSREAYELEVNGEKVRLLRAEVFARWRRRATIAFVGLAAAATLAGYLAYDAGEDSDRGIRQESARAITQSCRERLNLRITVAVAFDELRRAAVKPAVSGPERRQYRDFLERTQRPIDALLSEAADRAVVTDAGPIAEDDVKRVRTDGLALCAALAEGFRELSQRPSG